MLKFPKRFHLLRPERDSLKYGSSSDQISITRRNSRGGVGCRNWISFSVALLFPFSLPFPINSVQNRKRSGDKHSGWDLNGKGVILSILLLSTFALLCSSTFSSPGANSVALFRRWLLAGGIPVMTPLSLSLLYRARLKGGPQVA